jgi:hypothetical protein
MKHHMLRTSVLTLLGLLALLSPLPGSQPASAQEGSCIDDVTGWTNVCTAGDVWLSSLLNDVDTSCMPGELVTLNLEAGLLATAVERYDIGLFLAIDGGGADTGSCEHYYLPPPLASVGACSVSGAACKKNADCPAGETCTGGYDPESGSGPFYDAEPEDAPDECGDLEPGVDTYYFLGPVTVPCIDSDGDGYLDIGTAVSWDDQKDITCSSVADARPNTANKCHYRVMDVMNVTVLPGLIQVEKTAQPERLLEPGGWVKFTFVVENTSPITVTLEELVDSVYGSLEQAGGDCALPQTLGPAEVYQCAISAEVTGDAGAVHTDAVTAWGTNWNKEPVSGVATAEVSIVGEPPESGVGMPAAVVSGGMAAAGVGLLLAGVLLRRRTA